MFVRLFASVRLLSLLALAFASVLVAPQVGAQTTTSEVELVGLIEAMGQGTLTVNGLTIDISRAEITTPLALGLAVRVDGTLLPDGSIRAREVKAAELGILPGELEIIGVLESFAGTTMVIGGQVIDVASAEIEAGVVVGALVKVHLTLSATGEWIAREVELAREDDDDLDDDSDDDEDREGEFEIVGTLEEIGEDIIVVSGRTISTVGAEIKGVLVAGALVKVHLSEVDGEWVAREVELFSSDDDEDDDSDDDRSGSDDDDDDHSGSSSSSDDDDDHGGSGSGSGGDDDDDHGGGDDD